MPHQPPALFITDSAGLDFLNSIATPLDMPVDWIGDGEGLLAWLKQAQLVPPEVLETIRERASQEEIDRVAAQARRLREWFRAFVRDHRGKPLSAAALPELEPLNRLLAGDEAFGQLAALDRGSTSSLQLKTARRWRSTESLLLPIGQALARLLVEEGLSNVKTCDGPTCTLMFADRTRGRSRRWCSMQICGNRAKQIAHRRRSKTSR